MALDALSQILTALKMRGTIYYHTHFTPPWGVRVPPHSNVARFHIVIRGQCYIRLDDVAQPITLATGDLIVIPHGAQHVLSDAAEREVVDVDDVLRRTGYKGEGALVYGGTGEGHECQLFCGHFEFEEFTLHPILSALPVFIHLPNSETMNSAWLQSVMRFACAEVMGSNAGAHAIVHRLSEIIFIQLVRAYVDRAGEAAGCLAGVLDRQLSMALSAVHSAPEKPWTVETMAREAGMSRTLFAERFASLMGMAPLGYVTQWRMQMARRALIETRRPMIEIAKAVGYRSEPAFSRAFRRQFSSSPGSVRRGSR